MINWVWSKNSFLFLFLRNSILNKYCFYFKHVCGYASAWGVGPTVITVGRVPPTEEENCGAASLLWNKCRS
jgi:hypothetical protein